MKTEVSNMLMAKYGKKNVPELKSGDTVRIHQKIKEGKKERIQIFEGLVIATKHGRGLDGTFTVRKIAAGGIGVERTYPVHSPNIVKVERLKSAEVHRSKLYYMRDRLGKAARFKGETRTPMAWSESPALAAEPIADLIEDEIQTGEITAEEVAGETMETVPEADVVEVPTEGATESPEVGAEVADHSEMQEVTPAEAEEVVAATQEAAEDKE